MPRPKSTTAKRRPRTTKPKAIVSQRASDAIIRQMETELTREEIVTAIGAIDDPRFDALFAHLTSPDWHARSTSLMRGAKKYGIAWHEIEQAFRQYQLGIGMIRVAREYPAIMQQTAEDAQSRNDPCLRCDGTGEVPKGKTVIPCPDCRGTGTIHTLGDIERLKLIWDTTGLIKRGGQFQQNINLGGSPVDSFESLVGRAADAMDKPRVVDVQPDEAIEESNDA